MRDPKVPRYLRVLLIDDDQSLRVRPEIVSQRRKVAAPLEQITWQSGADVYLGIDSLAAAIDYWKNYDGNSHPDIVLSDVNFEKDNTSPLQDLGDGKLANRIPTGLSHCKAFAAIARSKARPLAITIFTQDAAIWARSIDQGNGSLVFGLLAAQEILELSAILGEPIEPYRRGLYQGVWGWLERRHAIGMKGAIDQALQSYRRLLIGALSSGPKDNRIQIPLACAKQLVRWCHDMQQTPRPLGPHGYDPGLELVYANGGIDKVFLSSLFADVKDIERAGLPDTCYNFKVPTALADAAFLNNGLPDLGAFVGVISNAGNSAQTAREALRSLPLSVARLADNLRDVCPDREARGFATLFRSIELEFEEWKKWSNCWSHEDWDPVTKRPAGAGGDLDDYGWTKSVKEWLVDVCEIVDELAKAHEEFSDEDVLEKIGDLVSARYDPMKIRDASLFLFQLAQSTRVVVRAGEVVGKPFKCCRPEKLDDLLRSPRRPPGGMVSNLVTELRDSLGFGDKGPGRRANDNALGQVLFEAFLQSDSTTTPTEKARSGRDFFTEFVLGNAPEGVKFRCREFCQNDLQWQDSVCWPFELGLAEK